MGSWRFDEVDRNLRTRRRECDLPLINDGVVVLASIKHKVREEDIVHLKEQEIPDFRRDFSELGTHQLYGAIGGLIIHKKVQEQAEKEGF